VELSFIGACCWFSQDAYVDYWKARSNGTDNIPTKRADWLRPLRNGSFFSAHPQYHNDLVLSNHGSVSASRFYVTGRRANRQAHAEAGLMMGLRELAAGSEPPMIPYCPEFVYYERYVSVKKNTLLPVGVTMIGLFDLVLLLFIIFSITVTDADAKDQN